MNKSTNLSLTLHCLAKMDQMDDGHMIMLSVINHEAITNIVGEPILDKPRAHFACEPFNYQPLYKAITYAIKKKGYMEHISCPIFCYEHNLN